MNRSEFYLIIILACFVSFHSMHSEDKKEVRLVKLAHKRLDCRWNELLQLPRKAGIISIDSIHIDSHKREIGLYFNPAFSCFPFREMLVNQTYQIVSQRLKPRFRRFHISIFAGNQEITTLIPNYFRQATPLDSSRILRRSLPQKPFLIRMDQPFFHQGLSNHNLALWASHGRYFEQSDNRWAWQRPRLFGSVEDLLPLTFVMKYLTPMLENTGATVWMPRERDTQPREIIVDNDYRSGKSEMRMSGFDQIISIKDQGFAYCDTLYPGQNPFRKGSSLRLENTTGGQGQVEYIPDIPEEGFYSVSISFPSLPENQDGAIYSIWHAGGVTRFRLDQRQAGGTWIYLGTFYFHKGMNSSMGKVILHNPTGSTVSADAVKFGGGSGNVARRSDSESDWMTSGNGRFLEGARYYLQYAGFPDSLVYSFRAEKNDYADDYLSRGEWVNYLMGRPNGPEKLPNAGLGIDIDLSLAFHTDAGIAPKDSLIGSLSIFCTDKASICFPDGLSKMVNRDLSDVMQSQLINDLQTLVHPQWPRRGLWDKPYSEAWRPNVPSTLLELLSHQNLTDIKYALDPRFQMITSRAIYKAALKFIAYQEKRNYKIQPLPVSHLAIEPIEGKSIRLSWRAVQDTLETSSTPSGYKVYCRRGSGGFDNGTLVQKPHFETTLDQWDQLYSFKVTSVNEGGESFPSVILSAGFNRDAPSPVLVVDAFDRVCAPATFDSCNMAGIAWWKDEGVSYGQDFSYTGHQYNFDRNAPWLNNDNPGWGASYANLEGKVIKGNDFDHSIIHGSALLKNGYSFVSVSDEAFESEHFDPLKYSIIDLIAGEEKTTPSLSSTSPPEFSIYTPETMSQLSKFLNHGGCLMLSGAYLGTDLKLQKDSTAEVFACNMLHFKWRADHSSTTGQLSVSDNAKKIFSGEISFNTRFNDRIYRVESPDALVPAGRDAFSALKYKENGMSASVLFAGRYKTVILGFPFETIQGESDRVQFMKDIMRFFSENE